jgi:hypothetical protein
VHDQFHGSTNAPLMVSLLFAFLRAADTMKNTIDEVIILLRESFLLF